ncbi:ABC transporter permease [Uliginosibacterium sp. H1]|uniref:ABC transporter permease n=1 Tax=Uliginosibacterium sp. H1 TaxID=3114757 RepID=UPI002E1760B5|nr:ABC transporter permease [Uliginosibacterium sp. H1]
MAADVATKAATDATGGARKGLSTRQQEALLPWLFIGSMVLLWQFACMALDLPAFVLPSPVAVGASIQKWALPILQNAAFTLLATLCGFAIAVVLGGALGVAIGSSRFIYRGMYPVLIGFNSIPKVAVVPLFVIWFGAGTVPAILTAFLVSFFPIAVNVSAGLANVEPELLDVLRALGASRSDILRKVGLPRTLPYFFASLKVSVTLAFVGAIIAETVAGRDGIGYLMMAATANFDTALVFAGLTIISLMGIMMYAIFAFIENRMTRWAQRDGGMMS